MSTKERNHSYGEQTDEKIVPSQMTDLDKILIESDQDSEINNQMESGQEYVTYKYRFFELTLYCLAIMMNMVCWMSLSPIASTLENAYGVGDVEVASMGFTFMVIFVPFNFPANWFLDRKGLRIGVS